MTKIINQPVKQKPTRVISGRGMDRMSVGRPPVKPVKSKSST